MADELAKAGAARDNGEDLPEDSPKIAMATVKFNLHRKIRAEWEKCWLLNLYMKWQRLTQQKNDCYLQFTFDLTRHC